MFPTRRADSVEWLEFLAFLEPLEPRRLFASVVTVNGTAGPDFLLLGNQGQLALALGGHDIVSGANGKDCIDGGDGNGPDDQRVASPGSGG